MSIEEFFREYFLSPIDERTGYNPVNTAVYAIIALVAAYLIYKGLKKLGVKVDERFTLSIIPFVLFGSTLRVVVDANILQYNYFTTTPGIYFLIGFTTIAAVIACHQLKIMKSLWKIGTTLWLFSLLPLLPLLKHYDFAGLVLVIAFAGVFLSTLILKMLKVKPSLTDGSVVFAHALDGAATFVTIDIFSVVTGNQYFEQHVITNMLAQAFGGFWAFYAIKLIFATGAVYIINRDKEMDKFEKSYILLLLMIFGLAPGVRDIMRLFCGV